MASSGALTQRIADELLRIDSSQPAAHKVQEAVQGIKAKNLSAWEASGKATQWLFSTIGSWDEKDIKDLVEQLKRSSFWPIDPNLLAARLKQLRVEMDLPPILRQMVKTQNPLNGELSHGVVTKAVHQGV